MTIVYTQVMKQIHGNPDEWRPEIGAPYRAAIRKQLMPKTNTGNLSNDWNVTDWVRYCIAEQLKRAGGLPEDCKAMLKPFYKDLDV